jgi:hypothetical protein
MDSVDLRKKFAGPMKIIEKFTHKGDGNAEKKTEQVSNISVSPTQSPKWQMARTNSSSELQKRRSLTTRDRTKLVGLHSPPVAVRKGSNPESLLLDITNSCQKFSDSEELTSRQRVDSMETIEETDYEVPHSPSAGPEEPKGSKFTLTFHSLQKIL